MTAPQPPKSRLECNREPPGINIVIALIVILWFIYVLT